MKAIHLLGSSVFALMAAGTFADCGDVTIADMNWSSASLLAHVDTIILREGFGCNAETVPGDSVPTGTSMIERGQPDIAPEMWTNSIKEALERGVEEGRLVRAGFSLSDGGQEGFWVPKYLVDENPALATIEGVLANAAMFTHPEDRDLSMLMGCPSGWACQITTRNLMQALNMEAAGFDLVDPGSAAGLAGSIARAYERKQPWLGYYWSPTPVMGKYDMVMVDFGSGVNLDEFVNCITKIDCADPKPTMFPVAPVETLVTARFAKAAPEALAYLQKRSFTNQELNELLAWMEDNQADGEFAAYHFLENYPAIWQQWVSVDVAEKVRKAL